MQKEDVSTEGQRAAVKTAASLPAVLAIIFGVFIIYGTGFAQPINMHNAAHDTRHSIYFPCH